MTTKREFDLVVYGAASFVGRLLTRYLVERHGAAGDLKWALAGRNQAKLDDVAEEFGAQALPKIIADAADAAAMTAMAARTRVISQHRWPLRALRFGAGCRLRRPGHRLLRSHRRAAVDATHDR